MLMEMHAPPWCMSLHWSCKEGWVTCPLPGWQCMTLLFLLLCAKGLQKNELQCVQTAGNHFIRFEPLPNTRTLGRGSMGQGLLHLGNSFTWAHFLVFKRSGHKQETVGLVSEQPIPPSTWNLFQTLA